MLLRYKNFLNELKIHNEYNDISKLDNTFFVVYKGNVYFFDFSMNDFIEKTKKFRKFLLDEEEEGVNLTGEIVDFDSAYDFFENNYYNHNPSITSGNFYLNSFNESIPIDTVIAQFFTKNYYDIRISDTIKKLMKLLPGLEYFEIDDEIYHKDDLIKRFGSNFNKQTKLPDIVYHGTSSQFIENILKNGIIPKPENTIFQIKNENYIFLSTSFQTASRYAGLSTSRDFNLKTKEIVLEIESNRLDKDKIVFDYDFYIKYVGKGLDSFNRKSAELGNSINKDLKFSNLSNKNVGGLFNKFGYNGIILPTKISKIHLKTGFWKKDWTVFTVPEFKEYMKNNILV